MSVIYTRPPILPYQGLVNQANVVDRVSGVASVTGTTALTTLHTLVIPPNLLVFDGMMVIIRSSGVSLGALGTKSFGIKELPDAIQLQGVTTSFNNNQGWRLEASWERAASNRIIWNCKCDNGGDYGVGGTGVQNGFQTQRDITLDPLQGFSIQFQAQLSNGGDTITQFMSMAYFI